MTGQANDAQSALGACRLGDNADDLYEALLSAHAGLDASASAALNARLVLILMNAVGDEATVCAAIRAARTDRVPPAPDDDR